MSGVSERTVERGEVLAGRYEVQQVLGEGGMGVVVAARHLELDQLVALKFMLPKREQSPEARGRFLREARAAAKLKSQHVARVLDMGTFQYEGGESPYIAMEYLEGCDLAQLLEQKWPLPVEDVVEYLLQASEAIGEAHVNGVVHRDLKPANLFLTEAADGSPCIKVLDFGISKLTSEQQIDDSITKTNTAMGTPHYMSPEQVRSSKDVDARSDIWALGVVAYELLTGHLPFQGESITELIAKILEDELVPPTQRRSDLPAALEEIVRRCLEKEPDDRWATVAEFASALVPFAPEHARPYGDRVSRVMGQRASDSVDVASADTIMASDSPGSVTGAVWPSSTPEVPTSKRRPLLVVAGAVAIVLIATSVYMSGSSKSASQQVSDTPTTESRDNPPEELTSVPEKPPEDPPAEAVAGEEEQIDEDASGSEDVEPQLKAPAPSPAAKQNPSPTVAAPPPAKPPPAPAAEPQPSAVTEKPAYCKTEDAFVEDENGILRRRPECK